MVSIIRQKQFNSLCDFLAVIPAFAGMTLSVIQAETDYRVCQRTKKKRNQKHNPPEDPF